ncbi:VCBS repeat-containing protein [Streptomyces alfalfae]|uniref:Histidine kinase n=1 Tax=Streptomyces alfalfae TaxID=1642299 RepID=A0ABM6GUJ1_9ACTN|nr:histidine kinase [Streptomyces alfalfae]AYA17664.1 VCBS repeat-containing protein [Streptomyces fradiae]RXX44875.1 VCBS repeat-containing protein [Streptomyces alfalfae]RZM95330.1 VCBS repeat-containing protein [Streptomyces alfalfae]
MRGAGVRGARHGGVGRRARRRTVAGAAAALSCVLLLTGCGGGHDDDGDKGSGDRALGLAAGKGTPRQPVPRGDGSKVDDDFNGDGARDLVLDDLVHRDHGDDAGIGIVYGGEDGLVPGARQLLSAHANGARTSGELPAAFESEASCDLDGDGFSDLLVSTDPPYDGQGRPPVPLQILFGSPKGLAGKAVKLRVPDRARFGNDWPDQPVCGDFDGDGANDLVLHASGARISFLRGPFKRTGAPRAADAPTTAPGNNLVSGRATDVDGDGYDDVLVRKAAGPSGAAASAVVLGGAEGPGETGVLLPAGTDVTFGRFGRGKGMDAAIATPKGVALRYEVPGALRGSLEAKDVAVDAGDLDGDGIAELVMSGAGSGSGGGAGDVRVFRGRAGGIASNATALVGPRGKGTTQVLQVADFDGDKRADLVLRTYRGDSEDTVGVYPGRAGGDLVAREPSVSFSTEEFLTMG